MKYSFQVYKITSSDQRELLKPFLKLHSLVVASHFAFLQLVNLETCQLGTCPQDTNAPAHAGAFAAY